MVDLQFRQPTRRSVLHLIGGGLYALVQLRVGAPTGARQRPAAQGANEFIDFCFRSGGDPTVFTGDDGSVIVVCRGLNGHTYTCVFEGTSHSCVLDQQTQPGPIGPVHTEPIGSLHTPELDSLMTAFPPADQQSDAPKPKRKKHRRRSHRRS